MFKPPFHTSVKLNRKEEGFYCCHISRFTIKFLVLYIIYTRSKYIFDVLQYILYIQFVQGEISTKISYVPIIYTLMYNKYRKIKTCQGNDFRTVLFANMVVVGCGGCLTVKN